LRDVDSRLLDGSARLASSDESTAEVWRDWLPVVEGVRPSSDPGALVVRKQVGDDSYETVFAQFIAARPGTLRLDYLPYPAQGGAAGWTTARWDA
jgi:hypothetical protein